MCRRAFDYLPAALRWNRVRFSIFLCFFLRMRLRRFLISEPIASATVAAHRPDCVIHGQEIERARGATAARRRGERCGGPWAEVPMLRGDQVRYGGPGG